MTHRIFPLRTEEDVRHERLAGSLAVSHLRVVCAHCKVRELCLPLGLSPGELAKVEDMVTTRRRIPRRGVLFRGGDRFEALYAIRFGFLKTTLISADGREQIMGFHMAGETVGMEAIAQHSHSCDCVALEDSEVCAIPYERLADISMAVPAMRTHLERTMSREISDEHAMKLLLGQMSAEERLAAFLLNLSARFAMRGYSGNEFVLRMTRREIGNLLGLKLETVSRTLTRLAQDGLIETSQKDVRILDSNGLRETIENVPPCNRRQQATG